MRFQLIDRILSYEPGKTLRAAKLLTGGEEYLGDHFPGFPVMPGVLMLEAVVEASAWLWRLSSDYQYTVMPLRDLRGVKYGNFMTPGYTLEITVDMTKTDGKTATFKGKGIGPEGASCITAQVTLHGYNLKDRLPHGAELDERLQKHWRETFAWLNESWKTNTPAKTTGSST